MIKVGNEAKNPGQIYILFKKKKIKAITERETHNINH